MVRAWVLIFRGFLELGAGFALAGRAFYEAGWGAGMWMFLLYLGAGYGFGAAAVHSFEVAQRSISSSRKDPLAAAYEEVHAKLRSKGGGL